MIGGCGWNGKETNSDNELSRNKVMKEAKPSECLENLLQPYLVRVTDKSNNWVKG